MTWRELRTFVRRVPPESWLARETWDEEDFIAATWDQKHELLATAVDVLNWANYQRGEGKGAEPSRYPRPGR